MYFTKTKSASHMTNASRICKTGHTGFEPVHDGTRNHCLTAWLMPKNNYSIIQHTPNKFKSINIKSMIKVQLAS